MPILGKRSKAMLATCHPKIQQVVRKAIGLTDFSVIEGHRGKRLQNHYFDVGLSTKRWPDGAHNRDPSRAVHLVPWPIDWDDLARFRFLGGVVMTVAHYERVPLRWGGDWDGDGDFGDQQLIDLAHFELRRDA